MSYTISVIIGWMTKWLLDNLLKICEMAMNCAYGSFLLGIVIGVCVVIIWRSFHNYDRYKKRLPEQ